MNTPFHILAALLSALLGFVGALAFDGMTRLDFNFDTRFFIRWLIVGIAFFICFAIMRFLVAAAARGSIVKPSQGDGHPEKGTKWALSLLGCAFLLCVAWIPYLIAMYPGNLYMDTSYQLAQYFSLMETGDPSILRFQHPLFDTFVFGFIVDVVLRATGDFQAGVFVLALLQIIFLSFSFSLFFNVARRRWKISFKPLLIVFLFCALLPLFPIMACTISKDSFFSWTYVLFFLAVLDICMCAKEKQCILKRMVVLLCVSAALMCLTKTTGIFVAIVGVFSLLCIRYWKRWQRISIVLPALFAIIVAASLAFALPRVFGIASGGAQETLSVPFQQSSMVLLEHGEEISDDEMQVIAKVLEVDTIEQDYDPFNADGVKGFSPRAYTSDYQDYVRVWLQQGTRYPYEYFKAWMLLESPVFSGSTIVQIFDSSWTTDDAVLPVGYNRKPEFAQEGSNAVCWFYETICGVPVLNLLFSTCAYAIFFPMLLLLVLLAARRFRSFMPVMLMILISLAILFVSPIAGAHFEATRYIMPFVFTTPLVLVTCMLAVRDRLMQQVETGHPQDIDTESADEDRTEDAPDAETEGASGAETESATGARTEAEDEAAAKLEADVESHAEDEPAEKLEAEKGDPSDDEADAPAESKDAVMQKPRSRYGEAYDAVLGNVRLGAHSVVRSGKKDSAGDEKKRSKRRAKKRAKSAGKDKDESSLKKQQRVERVSTDDVVVDFGNTGDDSQE